MTDARLHFAATERNRAPILEVLSQTLPTRGQVLEIASGSGEHAVFFAKALPHLTFLPSDPEALHVASIEAWRASEALPNVAQAQQLDVHAHPWPVTQADAVFCANMIHIAPWTACLALLEGAAALLPTGGPLVLYGPFQVAGAHTAPSNEAFDQSLRARDPRWGVRALETVIEEASARGLAHTQTVAMPANNLVLVLRRR